MATSNQCDALKVARKFSIDQNVCFRVLDKHTGKVLQEHIGHNSATNSMFSGLAHYLVSDLWPDQPSNHDIYAMLANYTPRYISLGTMGLINQDQDDQGLPAGIGVYGQNSTTSEEERFIAYMNQRPGYGADGYDSVLNHDRDWFGLGPAFTTYDVNATYHAYDYVVYKGVQYQCVDDTPSPAGVFDNSKWTYIDIPQPMYGRVNLELISPEFPRTLISYRDIVPESESELPKTIDVIFSAMISTGALAQFRPANQGYIFITEAGLWSKRTWENSGENGLLAGYRIVPPNEPNWDMTDPANRELLKQNILRVGTNQVVQVVWKIQLGDVKELTSDPVIRYERIRWQNIEQ